MGKKLIEEGTFVDVESEKITGRFVKWYHYDMDGLTAVVLMGDGRIRVVPAEELTVQRTQFS